MLRYTGIPVSIGIGSTKTLAKLANYVAKTELKIPVFNINQQLFWLSQIPVGHVWGIGRQWNKKLVGQGIYTAQDLASLSVNELKRYNVALYSTALELQGVACAGLGQYEPPKSIISSKSFGKMQTEYELVSQAISSHCTRAWEKLREQKLAAHYLSIFIRTNRFRTDLPQYQESMGFKLVRPTDDLRELVYYAKLCLSIIFRQGYHYQKVGVYFGELSLKTNLQFDLFDLVSEKELQQTEQLMSLITQINNK